MLFYRRFYILYYIINFSIFFFSFLQLIDLVNETSQTLTVKTKKLSRFLSGSVCMAHPEGKNEERGIVIPCTTIRRLCASLTPTR